MISRVLFPLALLVGLASLGREPLRGQIPDLNGPVTTKLEPPMAVPFGPGERLEYDVKLGLLGKKGEGFMEVRGLEPVRGKTTYHVTMAYGGGFLGFRVNDQFDSWFGVTDLVTLRSIENTQQLRRKRYKHFELYPERRSWERIDNPKTEEMPTSEPLDQISFFYFVRTLPLKVGEEYTFDRYYKESGNPVVLRVLRRDTVEVPAGTFPTIVVQPIIQSSGAFGDGGKAELFFSDDSRRLLVLMESSVPVIGKLSLHLRSIQEGRRLVPAGEALPEEDPPHAAPSGAGGSVG